MSMKPSRVIWPLVICGLMLAPERITEVLAAQGDAAQSARIPELPRLYIDTTYLPPSKKTIHVPQGSSFQAALNAAQPGDTITLQAGTTYRGPFTLPNKPGTDWIYIQSSHYSSLPPPGSRVGPGDAANMPKLVTASPPYGITTSPGAHHFRFVGIEITPSSRTFLGAIVNLGNSNETSVSQLPHHIIFDRCYVHGDPAVGSNKGIAANANDVSVIDSYISDLKSTTNPDTNAIWTFNSAGPIKIMNNYLEAGGENVMIGGAAPTIVNQVPSDIEIRRNHIKKPLSWMVGDSRYAGTRILVKNLIEFKLGRRVLVDGNVLENSWPDAQAGYAFMITPRNENGSAPWSVVQDLTITNNIIRRAASGVAMSGRDDPRRPTIPTARVLIANNLFEDIGVSMGGEGRLFLVTNGMVDLTIEHNTALNRGSFIVSDGSPAHIGFIYRNNIVSNGAYGLMALGKFGSGALNGSFPGAVFEKNVIIGPWPSAGGLTIGHYSGYPNNFFPHSTSQVGFINQTRGNYRLSAASPYRNAATDGRDIGAHIGTIEAATAGVVLRARAE